MRRQRRRLLGVALAQRAVDHVHDLVGGVAVLCRIPDAVHESADGDKRGARGRDQAVQKTERHDVRHGLSRQLLALDELLQVALEGGVLG
nr:MAG: hypothetical protein [Molluscum contagiosum virus]